MSKDIEKRFKSDLTFYFISLDVDYNDVAMRMQDDTYKEIISDLSSIQQKLLNDFYRKDYDLSLLSIKYKMSISKVKKILESAYLSIYKKYKEEF